LIAFERVVDVERKWKMPRVALEASEPSFPAIVTFKSPDQRCHPPVKACPAPKYLVLVSVKARGPLHAPKTRDLGIPSALDSGDLGILGNPAPDYYRDDNVGRSRSFWGALEERAMEGLSFRTVFGPEKGLDAGGKSRHLFRFPS
jgi:hypothetical protein